MSQDLLWSNSLSAGMLKLCVIVTTYNQPAHLDRCLQSLACQTVRDFEVVVADDGSGPETAKVINDWKIRIEQPVTHVWQPDLGFRKTRILNKAMAATGADYLVFLDGDCLAQPDFLAVHLGQARAGHYLAGSCIRLDRRMNQKIDRETIRSGKAFSHSWLIANCRCVNRRHLRLSLARPVRNWLNTHTTTAPHWIGLNSSCFRADALSINGFDNRFSYGFEDADFGNRLENHGVVGINVRWTANVLHLYHERPYVLPGMRQQNYQRIAPRGFGGVERTEDGFGEVA